MTICQLIPLVEADLLGSSDHDHKLVDRSACECLGIVVLSGFGNLLPVVLDNGSDALAIVPELNASQVANLTDVCVGQQAGEILITRLGDDVDIGALARLVVGKSNVD